MIRCPQCKFENPDTNKFCQKCGTALTVPVGSAPMSAENTETTEASSTRADDQLHEAIDSLKQEKPDAPLILWLAVVAPADLPYSGPLNRQKGDDQQAKASSSKFPKLGELSEKAIALQASQYLDVEQRYRLVSPVADGGGPRYDLEFKVVDTAPAKPSQLQELVDQAVAPVATALPLEFDLEEFDLEPDSGNGWLKSDDFPTENQEGFSQGLMLDSGTTSDSSATSADADDSEDTADLLQADVTPQSAPLPSPPLGVDLPDWESESTNSLTLDELSDNVAIADEGAKSATASNTPDDATPLQSIPAIAQLYLTVQNQLYPSLPQIYDAWFDQGYAFVLLEDRDNLMPLAEAIQHPETMAIQVLHWLHEMVELWAVLEPVQCCQSLLKLSNLRIDEDHILCLRRLYLDDALLGGGPSATTPLFKLGQVWRDLLQPSLIAERLNLSSLWEDLESGDIDSLNMLRDRLEDIADQLHQFEDSATPQPSQSTLDAMDTDEGRAMGQDSDITGNLLEIDGSRMGTFWADSEDYSLSDDELQTEGDEAPTIVLPMRLFNLTDAGLTDIGRQRDHNEDFFSLQSDIKKQDTPAGRMFSARGLYILCDGMGGHAAGEVASAQAVATLQDFFTKNWQDRFPTQDEIRAAIQEANRSIYELNQQNACHGSGRMGTTLVMMLVQDTKVAIAHVGDSRLYRFSRRGGIEQLTIDHEVGQREIQRGIDPAIAYARPDAYQLTQALGPRDEKFINPDIQLLEVSEDTLFILCSDGLTDNNLLENHWSSHVEPMLSSQANLEHELYRLIDLANQHNGHDNITAVVVRMKVRPKLQA